MMHVIPQEVCRLAGFQRMRAGLVLFLVALLPARADVPVFTPILTNGPASNHVNIVFLSEAYTSDELSEDYFLTDVTNAVEDLFSCAPYSGYTNYFNVFAISVASTKHWASHSDWGYTSDTYFGSAFDSNGVLTISSSGLTKAETLLSNYMPQCALPVVLVNDPVTGGSGGDIAVVTVTADLPEVLAHESGHTLAKLGDEYTNSVASDVSTFSSFPNLTSSTNSIPWKAWLDASTPIPTPQTNEYTNVVGVFEGGNYSATGWYRPQFNCMMNTRGYPFCAVCSEALIKSFYTWIGSPIVSVSPTNALVAVAETNPATFSVTTLQPAETNTLNIQWYIGGKAVSGATNASFTPDFSTLTNSLSVKVWDSTSLVRNDSNSLLAKTNTWALDIGGEQKYISLTVDGPGKIVPASNGVWVASNKVMTFTAKPSAQCTFTGWTGALTSSVASVKVTVRSNLFLTAHIKDATKPTVKISSPTEKQRLTSSQVTLVGTASDNVRVQSVSLSLNGGTAVAATGANSWTATVTAIPGTNVLQITALDTSSNVSSAVTRRFIYVVTSPLTINISGTGTLKPAYYSTNLEVGMGYSVKAIPGAGQVFAGWSDGPHAASRTFLMQSNLVLTASFIANPFTSVAGVYTGLLTNSASTTEDDASGLVRLTVTKTGTYSGYFQGAHRYTLSGSFWVDGTATNRIVRTGGLSTLELRLSLDLTNGTDRLTGTITNSAWTGSLVADRATFGSTNKTSLAGRYTLGLLNESTNTTTGDGVATVVVSSAGAITVAGALADGTAFSQSVSLARDGRWPLYARLYKGQGFVIGPAAITNLTNSIISGPATWYKAASSAKYYPGGLTNTLALDGSAYQTGSPILSLTNGQLILSGANVSITNTLSWASDNTLTVSGTGNVKLKVATSTGLISGSFTHPTTGATTAIKGIVLQQSGQARGYFLSGSESGQAQIRSQ